MSLLLPLGWSEHFSRSQQRSYYFHAATKQSLWSVEEVLQAEKEKAQTVVSFEQMVTAKLMGLKEDKEKTNFQFDPFDVDKRNEIHEIALTLGGLVTKTVGDSSDTSTDARCVVAYKFGFAPEEVEIVKLAAVRKKRLVVEKAPKASDVELEAIGTKKRDRRTIEDHELEKQKKAQQS